MTEVVVKSSKNLIQDKNTNKKTPDIPSKVSEVSEEVKKSQVQLNNDNSGTKKQKLLEKLAEKAKYNPNYLRETKKIEDIKLKQIYRPHLGPVY